MRAEEGEVGERERERKGEKSEREIKWKRETEKERKFFQNEIETIFNK